MTANDSAALRLKAIWRASDKYILFVLAVALVYALLRLSPSAYAYAFQRMEVPHKPGLFLGHARFLRSDEWAMWTPYIQAAVNNDFHRFNLTSIYHEDLRNFNVLPLRDWGLIFKPEMWSFFVVEPALAYSIFHAGVMAAFCIGWYGLFTALGFQRTMAALASLLLFYTPYVQCWFTTTGPAIALFPIIAWLFLSNWHPLIKVPLTAWLTAVWLMGHLYPPIDVSVAFAGAVLILAFRPKSVTRWGHLSATVIGGAIGVGLVLFYFRDVIATEAATLYPGQRVNGGGQVEFPQWLAQILPNFASYGEETFSAPNYLEANTSATYLLVFALCFAGWDRLKAIFTDAACKPARIALLALLGAFVLISLWQLLPLPSWMGAPLLWNRAPARRFVFANGAMLLAAALVIVRAAPPQLTPRRFLTAGALVIASYQLSKGLAEHGQFRRGTDDLMPLVALLGLWLFRRKAEAAPAKAMAWTALICGIAMWGFYNPIQSSWPIFHRPPSVLADRLKQQAAADPRHWVVYPSKSGAVFNGWGLPAVEHSLMNSELPFFRRQFPDLEAAHFNEVFNRFASVQLADIPVPQTDGGAAIVLPLQTIKPELATPPGAPLQAIDFRGGQVDQVKADPASKTVVVTGWAYVSGRPGSRLSLAGAGLGPVQSISYAAKPDVVSQVGDRRLARAGFTLTAAYDPAGQGAPLCVWADDPVFGRTWLNDAAGAKPCAPTAAAAGVVRPP